MNWLSGSKKHYRHHAGEVTDCAWCCHIKQRCMEHIFHTSRYHGFHSSPADDLGESLSIFFHTGNKKKSLKTFFSFEALETSEENLIKINQIAKVKGKIVPVEDKLQI